MWRWSVAVWAVGTTPCVLLSVKMTGAAYAWIVLLIHQYKLGGFGLLQRLQWSRLGFHRQCDLFTVTNPHRV
jgi:hypothetical protein